MKNVAWFIAGAVLVVAGGLTGHALIIATGCFMFLGISPVGHAPPKPRKRLSANAELHAALECMHDEFAAGALTIEQLESEAQRAYAAYDAGRLGGTAERPPPPPPPRPVRRGGEVPER